MGLQIRQKLPSLGSLFATTPSTAQAPSPLTKKLPVAKIAESGRYDLLVMGSHGHGALGNLVMGSVATQVLANCTVPVLLVR